MRTMLLAVAVPFFLAPVALAADTPPAASPAATVLAPGDMAPDFELPGSDGRTYRLSSYRGKQVVVLAWFAKAFTGG